MAADENMNKKQVVWKVRFQAGGVIVATFGFYLNKQSFVF
jgi:hypothetical protein